ncbi:hypothetical protein ACFE04_000404 [Oxalis oulophora]
MELCSDLQVDVNGEETFLVNKGVISYFCGRFRKLFVESKGTTMNLKVIFHDFPGGAQGFELLAKFCYNDGRVEITPSNVVLLNSVAHYMDMDTDYSISSNLRDQTEKFLQEIYCWSWSELLVAMKQLQDYHFPTESSLLQEKLVTHLVEKLASLSIGSPCISFSDNSGFLFSSDTRSSYSSKYTNSSRIWWFEDLLILDVGLIENVTCTMLNLNFEHSTVFKFLHYYQKSRYATASVDEKRKIMEVIVNSMSLLDRNARSCKGSFHIYREALRMNISEMYKSKLENLIGVLLDQATLDYLLVPSPAGKNHAYDVDLVLRLVKTFVLEGSCWVLPRQWKKVALLMDNYLAEVAPDFNLEPSKFVELVTVLPDFGRESHNGLYQAMDLYLQVHTELCQEEKMKFCSALNPEKLSAESLKHLAKNCKFPSTTRLKAYFHQHENSLNPSTMNGKVSKLSQWIGSIGTQSKTEDLENVCNMLQIQMGDIMKSESFNMRSNNKWKLCS